MARLISYLLFDDLTQNDSYNDYKYWFRAANKFMKKSVFNGPPSASFSFLFSSFQTNITILTKINVKNLHPVYSAGI